ncbi:Host cell factor [Orchesella cincta]|uniref:Host cell factor n=1 Tax=Orchesella cincta TaxID=48709 RepID=A0A1D2NEN4_ORCCI|nr:Host cell factor [Orchesella cincta]
MEFSSAEVDEAVSAFLDGQSSDNDLRAESLIQVINSPKPENRRPESLLRRRLMKANDLDSHVEPVGCDVSNATAAMKSLIATTWQRPLLFADEKTATSKRIRQPNVADIILDATRTTQGNPTTAVKNLSLPTKETVASAPKCLLAAPPDAPAWEIPFANKRINLLPSQTYMFRVAAVNSAGRGPWSEVTKYTTVVPAHPGGPVNIKIIKIEGGIRMTWEDAPRNQCGPITEYSVYLSVRPYPTEIDASKLKFMKLYCGAAKECMINKQTLTSAKIDTSKERPAVIFRVAARNSMSYGPATQTNPQ